MSRPEDLLPADLYYDPPTAAKYSTSSRIKHIQTLMTNRALSLLALTGPSLILDAGCGTCLSGALLSAQQHVWIGLDISSSMLASALSRPTSETGPGDLFLSDLGQGIPFRPGTFDAAISISAIQWLCNGEQSDVTPEQRLKRFFEGLYASLRRGGRAACQFYPKNEIQTKMITSTATRAGFGAGLLEDDPGTKNAKSYLVLEVGGSAMGGGEGAMREAVTGLEGGEVEIMDREKPKKGGQKRGKEVKGSKSWILRKKEQMERKGKIVKSNSRYTGRKRRIQF